MIRRTGEVTLTIIGLLLAMILQGLSIFFSFALLRVTDTSDGMQRFTELYNKSIAEAGVASSSVPSVNTILDKVHTFAGIFVIALIVTFILTILGIVLITGNKKPGLAGIIFLITAILVLISTFMAGFIPAILYFIAAIMCWARKPKETFPRI